VGKVRVVAGEEEETSEEVEETLEELELSLEDLLCLRSKWMERDSWPWVLEGE